MAESSPSRGPARDTRLLLLTLFVSVAVLFLLARFRFPERPLTDLSPPQPLSRLTRGLALDELSASLTDLLRRVEPSVVMLRVAAAPGAAPAGAAASGTSASAGGSRSSAVRVVPALRVRDDFALAPLGPGDRPIGIGDSSSLASSEAEVDAAAAGSAATAGDTTTAGSTPAAPAAPATPAPAATLPPDAIVSRDELRGLALVRVPARSAPALATQPPNEPPPIPGYIAVIEASPAGPTIRADFVSSLARATRPGAAPATMVAAGIRQAQRGALLFSLTGRFLGVAIGDVGGAAIIAPGEAVLAQVDRLARGESLRLARPGFDVQPLTPALARATGGAAKNTGGVVVSAIAAPGPDGPPVALGDVIIAANEQPIRSPLDWQRALLSAASNTTGGYATAGASAGAPLRLDVVRFGQTIKVTLPLNGSRLAGAATTASGASASASAAAGTGTKGPTGAGSAAAQGPPPQPGATFRNAPDGTLDVVSVTPNGAAARAGLRSGDRITALLPSRGTLSSARLTAAFAALPAGGALVLAVDRPEGPAIVALDKP